MSDPTDIDEGLRQLPELPEVEPAVGPTSTDPATLEAKQIASGLSEKDIKARALHNEAERTENFRDHFETLAVITLYLIWGSIAMIGLVWVYHLVAPPCWFRLPPEQVRHLQSIITGGVLAGIAGTHVKRRLS